MRHPSLWHLRYNAEHPLWQLSYNAFLNFRASFRPRAARERGEIVRRVAVRLILYPAVAFENFSTKRRQRCPAAARTASCGRDDRLSESLIDAVQQQPRALVGHAHLACGSRDRARVTDAFEQPRITGA